MIVITGSESFIGKALASRLDKFGMSWVGIDSNPADRRTIRADVRDGSIDSHIPQGAEAIVHLAAISRDSDCRRDPRAAFDVNVGGTLNLMAAARRRGVSQFVFASSEWVYGEVSNGGVQREDSPIDATRLVSEYALSKLTAERLLISACRRGELPSATILRFGIVYGPRPENWSAVESLYHAVATQPVVEVKGSLRTARRFIHVDDICAGVCAALGRAGYDVFNLTGDRLVSLGEIIGESIAVSGRTPRVIEHSPDAVSIRNPDNSRARSALGWRPRLDLAAGLATLPAPVAA
jgi:nucleoside-diphosphate-sugar epimerase